MKKRAPALKENRKAAAAKARKVLSETRGAHHDELTARQRAFVAEYIKTSNARASAIAVGYGLVGAGVTGHRLLNNDKIKAEIEKHYTAQSTTAGLNAEWVLKNLKAVAERCMQAEPVVDRNGPTGEYKFDSSGANRSLELIGKHLRMFIERVEQSGPNGGPIQVEAVDLTKLSDEDLERLELIISKASQP